MSDLPPLIYGPGILVAPPGKCPRCGQAPAITSTERHEPQRVFESKVPGGTLRAEMDGPLPFTATNHLCRCGQWWTSWIVYEGAGVK